jgi:ectoine hydroxylase-related dioxygenase (phytanoyl-CoA dioxygenase family)
MKGLIGQEARVIRAFYLDKTPEENWALAWHQDTTLAFVEPLAVEGFHAWVNKAHFFHAQAPAEIMGRVLSTRIHLDTISAAQGPLKVLPGSHVFGVLKDDAIAQIAGSTSEAVLPAIRGEVVLMRPLLLHGSDRATVPQSRRILHLEWVAFDPPGGLRWAWF